MLVYQATIESLDAAHGDLLAPIPFKYFSNTKQGKSRGRLTGQRPAAGIDFEFIQSIYVNDKALLTDSHQAATESSLSYFSSPYLSVNLKASLYKSIVVNLLLWGCENWALRK